MVLKLIGHICICIRLLRQFLSFQVVLFSIEIFFIPNKKLILVDIVIYENKYQKHKSFNESETPINLIDKFNLMGIKDSNAEENKNASAKNNFLIDYDIKSAIVGGIFIFKEFLKFGVSTYVK